MNIKDSFPSKWLKADDLEGDMNLTIKGVEQEMLDDGPKPVVSFREIEKGLVLNKTNARTIAKLYGVETGAWAGKTITIFPTQVDYRGEQVAAIRVRVAAPPVNGTKAIPTNVPEDEFPF
ncbi:MAG TPA: hypothetical protein VI699_00835 [Candidatus Acidoferrales bacterium]|nr:hypothetical protein [Candidatus Acidoferrales bacterium]